MKTIIVPTDFSKNAHNALNYAIDIAKHNEGKIVLLHSIHYDVIGFNLTDELESTQFMQIQKAAEEKIAALEKEVKSIGLGCTSLIEVGILKDVINEIAERKRASLIVMGTSGAKGVKEFLIGSNTGDLIGSSHTPVLAVPEDAKFEGFHKIVFTTNYERKTNLDFKHVIGMFEHAQPEVHILHIANGELNYTEEEKLLNHFVEEQKEKFPEVNIKSKLLYGEETEFVLRDYVKREGIELVTLTTKHRNLFERIFGMPSVTKKMVYHSSKPILAFNH